MPPRIKPPQGGTGAVRPKSEPPDLFTPDGSPVPPPNLPADTLCAWQEIVPPLVESGAAKACDSLALVILCDWVAEYRRVRLFLDGRAVTGGDGALITRLAIATDKIRQYGAAFGLTPVDRAKLGVVPKGKPKVDSRKR